MAARTPMGCSTTEKVVCQSAVATMRRPRCGSGMHVEPKKSPKITPQRETQGDWWVRGNVVNVASRAKLSSLGDQPDKALHARAQ